MLKKTLICFFIFVLGSQTNIAQEKKLVKSLHTVTTRGRLDTNIIYDKDSGEKIPEKTVIRLIQENPKVHFERVYNKEAEVIKYLYDPNDQQKTFRNDRLARQPIEGFNFPNFMVTTVNNKKIELQELKGKLVLVRFAMEASGLHSKTQEIIDLEKKIKSLPNSHLVQGIVIFNDSKEAIKQAYDTADFQMAMVANGRKFEDMLGVTRFPSTYLIDENGILIKNFRYSEDIDLSDYIN